ncbi:hypothetical protein, partial [Humibacillus sp. DSM 29435]|uniref:hypothetical protein n=1 Tax=Humibacillus sp. DSM 29435 TaxID=1869167 RepID=UPI001C2F3136
RGHEPHQLPGAPLKYEEPVNDEVALLGATQDLEPRLHGDRVAQLSDHVAELLQTRIEANGLDVPGARVLGHSLTLPG